MTLRVIFLGTPDFAVPSLKVLLADPGIEVAGVMTQPDRPSGRGQKLTPPPVKVLALEHGIEVQQPERLRKEPDMISWLRSFRPDYLVTAAFGQILSQEVLDIPKLGTVNVHASLLPQYRGANPVQWCILNGDAQTGVTTMFTALAVDAGPMLIKSVTDIDPNEDAATLTGRLAQLGADILPQTLHGFAEGTLQPQEQDESQVTHAPKLSKEDAWIDWSQSAEQIHNKVRGQQPWPGAVTLLNDVQIKILRTRAPQTWPDSKDFIKQGKPGDILGIIQEGLVVQTRTGPLLVETVQSPGKPKTPARDWANGTLPHVERHQFTLPETVELTGNV